MKQEGVIVIREKNTRILMPGGRS